MLRYVFLTDASRIILHAIRLRCVAYLHCIGLTLCLPTAATKLATLTWVGSVSVSYSLTVPTQYNLYWCTSVYVCVISKFLLCKIQYTTSCHFGAVCVHCLLAWSTVWPLTLWFYVWIADLCFLSRTCGNWHTSYKWLSLLESTEM